MIMQTHAEDRRTMVQQISEHLQLDAHYQGPPSFSYAIGPITVARDGSITCEDEETLEILKPFLIEHGFMEQEVEPEVSNNNSGDDPERMYISVPAEDITVEALKNLTYMLYSKQYLINRSVGNGVLDIPDSLITRLAEYTPDTPEAFSELLGDFIALDELDGFDYRDGNVTLGFPFYKEQPERWTAYANLLSRIIKAARSATRVHTELKETENEKYAMRAWLIRLGYGGANMKAERHLLLHELSGYTAFRTAEDAAHHKEKYAEIRRIAREQKKEDAE